MNTVMHGACHGYRQPCGNYQRGRCTQALSHNAAFIISMLRAELECGSHYAYPVT